MGCQPEMKLYLEERFKNIWNDDVVVVVVVVVFVHAQGYLE